MRFVQVKAGMPALLALTVHIQAGIGAARRNMVSLKAPAGMHNPPNTQQPSIAQCSSTPTCPGGGRLEGLAEHRVVQLVHLRPQARRLLHNRQPWEIPLSALVEGWRMQIQPAGGLQ